VSLRLNRTSLSTLRTATHQWVPGDVHIHMNYGGAYRNTPENLVRQAEAEGLSVVHNLIVNKEQRIPDVEHFRGDKIDPASTARTLLLHSQEYHTSAWGHLGLLGLRENLLIPDYADYPQTAAASLYPSNNVVSDLARAQGALVGYVHPFDAPAPDPVNDARLSYALPADVAHGKVDYLEVMGFSDHLITSDVWYRLLNLGYRIPAAAGTDAMMNYASLRGPLGLVRVYVKVPIGAVKIRPWLDGLRAGRTFVTNGPLLAFRLGGKEIGDEVKLPSGGSKLEFSASVRSIVPLDHAQIVCNGEVVQELTLSADRMSAEVKGDVTLARSGWCVLRAYAEKATHPILDLYPFASTSPIYTSVDGAPPRSPADAAFFVQWMDRVLEFTRARSNWNTPDERTAVLDYLEAARIIFLDHAGVVSEVRGMVVDETGARIPNALLSFSKGPDLKRRVTTGADGTFSIRLENGAYELLVKMAGFCDERRQVGVAGQTTLDKTITLKVCPIDDPIIVKPKISPDHRDPRDPSSAAADSG